VPKERALRNKLIGKRLGGIQDIPEKKYMRHIGALRQTKGSP
jgi:hypothetical protein